MSDESFRDATLSELNKTQEINLSLTDTATTLEAGLINGLAAQVHHANKKWWVDLETGAPKDRNYGEMIALIHSELSEALEGARKDLMDDKLPHRKMEEVEMADVLIRLLDYCAGRKLDIGGAYVEKMKFNAIRKDHTREERLKPHGKKI